MSELTNKQEDIVLEQAKDDKGSGFLEEVRKEREALEKVRDELKELRSVEILSGKADAGQPTPEEPKELTPKEYAQKVMRGEI